MSDKHIVIIGHGIAARCVIFELNKRGFKNITVVASDAHAKMCSTRTTAINCLRGTKPGKSDLGDLILKSFSEFEDFCSKYNPRGISKTFETHCTPLVSPKLSNWNRRYGQYEKGDTFSCFSKPIKEECFYINNEAYIIVPEILYKWMESQTTYKLIDDIVIDVQKNEIQLKTGKSIQFDDLVICTSFMSKDFSHLVADPELKHKLMHSKPVPGSYLKFDIKDFNPDELDLTQTYCYRIDEVHLIVRTESQDVLIGATSKNNTMDDSGDTVGMQEQMKRLSQHLEGVVTLPGFNKGELITGIRHKGQNRNPYWGEVNSNIYAAWGLYKNAFTFAFSASREISRLIQK